MLNNSNAKATKAPLLMSQDSPATQAAKKLEALQLSDKAKPDPKNLDLEYNRFFQICTGVISQSTLNPSYFSKIFRINLNYGVFTQSDFICGVHLFNRLLNTGFELNPNPKTNAGYRIDIFFICIMIGVKTNQDNPFNNRSWGEILNAPTALINQMELDVLTALKYEVMVSPEEYALALALYNDDKFGKKPTIS